MTREELLNSFEYKITKAETEAMNKLYPTDKYAKEREGFAEGSEWARDWLAENYINLPNLLGKERYVWLSKCCDVVRNTKMDEDLRECLINTFMRL